MLGCMKGVLKAAVLSVTPMFLTKVLGGVHPCSQLAAQKRRTQSEEMQYGP